MCECVCVYMYVCLRVELCVQLLLRVELSRARGKLSDHVLESAVSRHFLGIERQNHSTGHLRMCSAV
jgi:hypothetical protein